MPDSRYRTRQSSDPSISTSITSPLLRKTGGFRANPTPGGVPVAITSPGSSVIDSDRKRSIQAHQISTGLCLNPHRLSIPAQLNRKFMRVRNLVGRYDPLPHRGECVTGFTPLPLTIGKLKVARTDIINNGVAQDVVVSLLTSDVFRASSNHHGKFSFVIYLFAFRRHDNRFSRPMTEVENFEKTTGLSGIGILLSIAWSR